MVRLSLIESKAGTKFPEVATIFAQLDLIALPIADEKDPLRIIAPAVYQLHTAARRLQQVLANPSVKEKNFQPALEHNFDTITDVYTILRGISPPKNPLEKILYDKEVAFNRRLVEIAYEAVKEAEKSKSLGQPIMPKETRERLALDLADALEQNPLPAFASREHMVKQWQRMSVAGWAIVILWVLYYTGFLRFILELFISQ